ncbi:MAG: hypothetical protein JRM76_04875 [Nitrososphaerota archaeon]|nr:hypothetical protein [Nitrososphaerota archaeon]MCL5672760.1 hypothetical protein [Nitrososphaerota archaeon]MDG6912510.1 hypothetical protein [Nitrososphaerota archaeon]MDG6945446.1 hypothetical protein [Nitrososphaerota archaeon]MDG6952086.1 hypothetical protein [Nitrososphaerota archaeon]
MGETGPRPAGAPGVRPSIKLSVVTVFSALITASVVFSIPLPPPVYEITWSPAIIMVLAVLIDVPTAAAATGIGGFIGEAYNVAFKGGGSPIYPFGMIWARVPEVIIIAWARNRGTKTLVAAMVCATVFETLAFFFSDWFFYAYGLFSYSVPAGQSPLGLASFDFATMVDLVYIPAALAIIRAAAPAFRKLGFMQYHGGAAKP